MKIKLRTRWSIPTSMGMFALFFILLLIINEESIFNPYLITLTVLFIIFTLRFFGTKLIINDEFIVYQHWMLRKKKVFIKDIENIDIQRGKIRQFLKISTPDMSFKIFPYFSVTLISILSVIAGRPYKFEEAQNQLRLEIKKKRIIDFALVGVIVCLFGGLFFSRVSVMNQPEVIVVRITPGPEFPLDTDLNSIYSLYEGDIRIWSNEDAANAALYALKPELSIFSRLFNNKYLVYYNNTDKFYVVYKLGLPNELSYICFVEKGGYEVYFMSFGEE